MKLLKKHFEQNAKQNSENLRNRVLNEFKEDNFSSIENAIKLLEEAIKLDPEHLGQYLSLASILNTKCKYIIINHHEFTSSNIPLQLFLDSTKALTALNVYTKSSGGLNQEIKRLFDELQIFGKIKTDCKFFTYLIKGVNFIGLHVNNDGKKYEIYQSNNKTSAFNFLKSIPKNIIPSLFYVIVETPEGNFGKDVDGVFNEKTGEEIIL